MSKVAFLGLGIMGSRMSANLLKEGNEITVWNRSKEPIESLVSLGAIDTESPSKAVEDADFVVTMFSKPEVVKDLALGEDGFVRHMLDHAIWVDSTTVNPSFAIEVAIQVSGIGKRYIDAPVAGSKPQAEAAELTFFASGNTPDIDKATPLMEQMGKKVMNLGNHGQGSAFKMLVNAMLGESMLIFAETVALGEKMGLDRDFLLSVLPNLPVIAPFTKMKADMISKREYDAQFPLEHMHKDLALAAQTAYEYGQPMPALNTAKEVFAHAKNQTPRLDFGAIYEWINQGSK